MAFDFYCEAGKLWDRLERYGKIIGYKRPGDAAKYNIYLKQGLITILCKNQEKQMTLDSFLYLWLRSFDNRI